MAMFSKVNGNLTRYQVLVYTNGMIRDNIKATGSITKCMELELTNGQMEKPTRENTRMMFRMDKVPFLTQMVNLIKLSGKMGFNRARENK